MGHRKIGPSVPFVLKEEIDQEVLDVSTGRLASADKATRLRWLWMQLEEYQLLQEKKYF